MDDVTDDDFFEEDEPIEDVIAAFEAGPHGLTAPHLPHGAVLGVAPLTYNAEFHWKIYPGTIGVQFSSTETPSLGTPTTVAR